MRKKLTRAQIDKQILDHADEIIKLMKLKGWQDDSRSESLESIQLYVWHDSISVEAVTQGIKTIRRKKK